MLGCCEQISRRWHCLGAQVFVLLAKDIGRLSESNAFSRREESSLIHGVRRRVRLVAWLPKCGMAVNDAFAACVAGYGSHSPEVLNFGRFGKHRWCSIHGVRRRVRLVAWLPKCRVAVNDAFAACVAGYGSHSPEVLHFGRFGKHRWYSRSLTIDLLQTRATWLHQCGKVSSQGEYSESSTHVQAVLPTVGLAEIACGYHCEQLLLALDHGEELFPKLRTPTSLMVQVKNKTQNWAIHWVTLAFLVSKRVIRHDLIQLEVVRMTMYEENSMDFCITTLG